MSRKAGYGIDYDDYEYYEDYDEYDDVYEENDKEPTEKPAARDGIWRCSICTYDNDNHMSYCEICGVFRFPPANHTGTINRQDVGDAFTDSEPSSLAKSVFSSFTLPAPKEAMKIQALNECTKFPRHFHDFCSTLGSHSKHHVNIVPFKFDTPSPDDLVSIGLKSSKATLRGSSSVLKNETINIQASAKGADRSTNISESKQEMVNSYSNQGNFNNEREMPSSSTRSNNSPEVAIDAKQDRAKKTGPVRKGDLANDLASTVENVSLNAKSGSPKYYKDLRKGNSREQYKPEEWMLPDKREGVMTQLNLAIVGHVDSGKSTLSGRLLHLAGRVTKKDMHKYEKEAKLQGKGSFAYAWALDESTEERERGITMTVAVAYFDTKRYHVVVLDSPGHKDFVPNMISGATQADAAILVIDASMGSFEAGMNPTGGQTREHAQLIRSFGVDQVIVAINKMDSVDYSKERFDFVKLQVGSFLRSCNFKDSLVSWIPLSAIANQNLMEEASDARLKSWYHGSNLLDAIDSLKPPTRDYMKPLVMPVCDVVKSRSTGQVAASGKLEAGALRSGCKVLVMPSGDIGTVRSVECSSRPCPIARAGDNVAVTINGVDAGQVIAGGVLCHPDYPVRVTTHLELKVVVLDVVTPILIGSQLEFHIHHSKEAARVVKILSLLDPKTGKVGRKSPRCLVSKQNAVIEVVLQGAVCAEEFSICKALGRVFLRASGRTVALGVVTQIMDDEV